MIQNVKKTWRDEYQPRVSTPTEQQQQAQKKPTMIDLYLRKAQMLQTGGDEFNSYIQGPPTVFNSPNSVIPWFLDPSNPWPAIKQQALDLLSIPAMSTELERVFSQSKLTITPMRNRLSEQTIETLELLRHWWTNNIIAQQRGGCEQKAKRRRKPLSRGNSDINTTTSTTASPIG